MGKQPKPATTQLQFIDYGIVPVSVDTVTECRPQNGLACISLGASTVDGNAQARVVVQTRFRMSLPFLKKFHADLGRLIATSEQPSPTKN